MKRYCWLALLILVAACAPITDPTAPVNVTELLATNGTSNPINVTGEIVCEQRQVSATPYYVLSLRDGQNGGRVTMEILRDSSLASEWRDEVETGTQYLIWDEPNKPREPRGKYVEGVATPYLWFDTQEQCQQVVSSLQRQGITSFQGFLLTNDDVFLVS